MTTEITYRRGPELFFGLVGAIGTDLDIVTDVLSAALADVSYRTEVVRLSDLLKQLPPYSGLRDAPLDMRYTDYMGAGSELREKTGRGDAVAILGIQEIQRRRDRSAAALETKDHAKKEKHCETCQCNDVEPPSRTAYILRSLKHPDEVTTLRRIYGPGFFLISAYSPRDIRLKRLERLIADSHNAFPPTTEHTHLAEHLIATDEKEEERSHGQNVRGTFPKADVFIDASLGEAEIRADIERFIALLFGQPFTTPTPDENAMFHARAAALRSAEFGRQVGAAITSADGELLAVGTNEVPKAFGGQYWPPKPGQDDHRDFNLGEDTSERMKRNNLAEVLAVLKQKGLLSADALTLKDDELLKSCLPLMSNTRLMNSIEFGRAVHAEMGAITEAAKRGVSLGGGTLYTTTFPCHNCARHIVSTGIRRVVYIEPYAKSLAGELHEDSIAVESAPLAGKQVPFVPFVGIAPRRYSTFFQMVTRKDEDGKKVKWQKAGAVPRVFPPTLRYMEQEDLETKGVKTALDKAGFTVTS